MAYLNSNNYVVLNDWDTDPNVGANGVAIYGLLPGKLIRITIESGQAYPGAMVALFTDNSWDYYSEMYVEGTGEFVELTLADGENVVLSQASGDNVQISIVYVTEAAPVDVYSQPSIVPAAVSSELDNHGEERIHIAPYVDVTLPEPGPEVCAELSVDPYESPYTYGPSPSHMPSWWEPGMSFAVRFPDSGTNDVWYFYYDEEYETYRAENSPEFPFNGDYEATLHGQIAEITDDSPDNFNWSCVHATTYAPA